MQKGIEARLKQPHSIALDGAGGLYIANAHKTSPGSAEILRETLAARGLPTGR